MGSAPSAQDAADAKARTETSGTAGEMAELRRLLLGPEQARIRALQARLDDPELRVEELSQIVAEAIALRSRRDQALNRALYPVIEEALKISVARHPQIVAESLFPIIGAAVRKAVARALRDMVESLNQILESKFSWQSMKWRLEALRTGKSFAEIALMRSLRYRVEQVFLIHRETGLLLQHVTARNEGIQDTDMVSGMLTAVQDFVSDSFGAGKSEDLDTMQSAGFTIWLQYGPTALMAAVISGTPPAPLRDVFQRELETIHGEFAAALAGFSGDASTLDGAKVNLQRCLLGGEKVDAVPSYRWVWVVGALVLIFAAFAFQWSREVHRWNLLVERLRAEPGIVVTDAQRHWRGYTLGGLRDPMAADPNVLLRESGIAPGKVAQRWEPYLSLAPRFAELRQVASDREALEMQVLHFPLNSSRLLPEEIVKIGPIEKLLRKIQTAARNNGQKLVIEIYGHTDSTGKETANALLSQSRAEVVAAALQERGISSDFLKTIGMGDRMPEHPGSAYYPTELDRRVHFTVVDLGSGATR